jgi:hypothetical protein
VAEVSYIRKQQEIMEQEVVVTLLSRSTLLICYMPCTQHTRPSLDACM